MAAVKYKRSREKQEQMQATRKAILSAAYAEFSRHGYEKASMAKIASKAKTAKGTLYTYFKTKKDLYAQIARDIRQLLEKQIVDTITDGDSGFIRVRKVGRSMYDFFRKNQFYYQVFSFLNANIAEIIKNDERFEDDRISEITIASIELGKQDGSIANDVHPVKFIAFASSTIWGMLMFMYERGDMILDQTGLSEKEMVDFSFSGMEGVLIQKNSTSS